jgi:enolase
LIFLSCFIISVCLGKLGANAILGVSMAICRAGAFLAGVPLYRHIANLAGIQEVTLPCPAFNVINGGVHASNAIAFQEFMVLPTGAHSFSEAMKIGTEVYQCLRRLLGNQYKQGVQVGDEGGFAPNFDSPATVLRVIQEAVAAAGHQDKCHYALDVAASGSS